MSWTLAGRSSARDRLAGPLVEIRWATHGDPVAMSPVRPRVVLGTVLLTWNGCLLPTPLLTIPPRDRFPLCAWWGGAWRGRPSGVRLRMDMGAEHCCGGSGGLGLVEALLGFSYVGEVFGEGGEGVDQP